MIKKAPTIDYCSRMGACPLRRRNLAEFLPGRGENDDAGLGDAVLGSSNHPEGWHGTRQAGEVSTGIICNHGNISGYKLVGEQEPESLLHHVGIGLISEAENTDGIPAGVMHPHDVCNGFYLRAIEKVGSFGQTGRGSDA